MQKNYFLKNNENCDAKKNGLQSGKDFDRWFKEEYLEIYEKQL